MDKLAIEMTLDYGKKDQYRVVNVSFPDQMYKSPGKFYCYANAEDGIKIRNASATRKMVIGKKFVDQMVSFDDFKIIEGNSVEDKKQEKLREIYLRLNDEMATVTGLRLYSFFSDMVMLASQGFFITEENREEVYLKIIDTADEELIKCLETYLESKDKIDEVTNFQRKVSNLIRALERSQTEEEIEKALEDYEYYAI